MTVGANTDDDNHMSETFDRVSDQPLLPLPRQPDGVGWPTEIWPEGVLASGVDAERVTALTTTIVADQPKELGQTLAMLVVHRGAIVAECYGPDLNADTKLISWSMAKSMTQTALGMMVLDGLIDPDMPAPIPEWSDNRGAITVRHLLRMRSGLTWNEDYVDGDTSHVIEMLFGTGASDMGSFAAALPLEHPPDAVWNYSSGTTNILSRVIRDTLGGGDAYAAYLADRLFGPLGMASATPTFDEAGTFVGSSYVHATARDFARYGLFGLRDGVFDGERLVPEGWMDSARTMHAWDPEDQHGYGEHWWVMDDQYGTFSCNGYEGQRIACVPALDLVVVRLGKTPIDLGPAWRHRLVELIDCFAV